MNQPDKKASYHHAVNPNSRAMRGKRKFDRKLANFQVGHEAKKGYAEPAAVFDWQSRNAKRDCPPCRGTGEIVITIGHQEHRQECQRCRGFGWLEAN